MSRVRKSTQFTVRVPYDLTAQIKELVTAEVTATDIFCDALELYFVARSVMKDE